MKFGEKVRDLRKKHSLTQDELAQCLGINKRTIIGWERDGRYPRSVEMLEKMADIFHVPLTYLQPDQSLFIERAAEAYGKKGKIEAQHHAFELTELFASGEFKSVMSIHQSVCLDLSDKVQHFLRTSHCKRRNHKISSSVKGFLDDF